MRRIVIFMQIVCICLLLVSCRKKQADHLELTEVAPDQETVDADSGTEKATVFVYVCGAVINPGVYKLSQDSRVYEAIALAGGFTENADVTAVNQAELVKDGSQLYVPEVGEILHNFKEYTSQQDGKININQASREELMTLPGVGQSRAESIISYREEYGNFQSIEDIMKVSGIKEGLFEKIKALITV